jgi:hypothetical protein
MDLGAVFSPITAWFDAHPSAVAWLMGWIAALSAGQMVKQFLPPTWGVTSVKRYVQMVAILVGTLVSEMLWPPTSAHALVYAVIVGMSSPTAYTIMKAVVEWRFPELAYRLSWQRVQDRNGIPPSPDCPR